MSLDAQIAALNALKPGWDGYTAPAITDAALRTAQAWNIIPTSSGGIQFEMHRDNGNVEIEIASDGSVTVVAWQASERAR